MNMDFTVALQ